MAQEQKSFVESGMGYSTRDEETLPKILSLHGTNLHIFFALSGQVQACGHLQIHNMWRLTSYYPFLSILDCAFCPVMAL